MRANLPGVLIPILLAVNGYLVMADERPRTGQGPPSSASTVSDHTETAIGDRASWMEVRLRRLGDRPLKRLVLPASHDSAMYQSGLLKSLAQTQDLTIYQQLAQGIRWFDLRPQSYKGKLSIHHGPVTGPALEEVLTDVRRFMTEGHRELVILKFSHYEGFDGEAFDRLVKQINASLGPWLFKSLPRGKMLADTSLAEYVGKTGTVLVVCDELYPLDRRSKGIWVYRDWDSAHPEDGDLRVFDQYANTVVYAAMKADQFDKFDRYDARCKRRHDVPCDLFLLSWTLTPTTNVRGYAPEANRNLAAATKDLKIPNRHGCVVNLVYADYVEIAHQRRCHPMERSPLISKFLMPRRTRPWRRQNRPRRSSGSWPA